MGQALLNGGDAARVLAADHIGDLLRERQLPLFDDAVVADDVDRDVVINIAEHVQVDAVEDIALHLDDVLPAHLLAVGVLDDGHLAVQLVQAKLIVDVQALSGLDVIQDDSFVQSTDVQHGFFTPRSVMMSAIRT